MKYERGDVVRLVSKRPFGWNNEGQMDMFLDTIQVVQDTLGGNVYFSNPLTRRWSFNERDIAGFIEAVSEGALRLLDEANAKYPLGTKFHSAMSGKKFTSKGMLYPKVENAFVNILDKGENYIYYRGRWAELRTPAKPSLTFNGSKVTYDGDENIINVGCKAICKEDLEDIIYIADKYNITSIVVDGSRTVPTSELVKWLELANG